MKRGNIANRSKESQDGAATSSLIVRPRAMLVNVRAPRGMWRETGTRNFIMSETVGQPIGQGPSKLAGVEEGKGTGAVASRATCDLGSAGSHACNIKRRRSFWGSWRHRPPLQVVWTLFSRRQDAQYQNSKSRSQGRPKEINTALWV